MKELRNNVDTEVVFTELKEAKKWYLPKDNVLFTKSICVLSSFILLRLVLFM